MNRIMEELACNCVLAPQEVAASTLTASQFVDMAGLEEISFLIATGSLGDGKTLAVELHTSADSSGSTSEKVGEATFTAAAGATDGLAQVSYKVRPGSGRYVGVKFQHTAAAAVECAVLALGSTGYRPAAQGWSLVV